MVQALSSFHTKFAENIFYTKYAHGPRDTWEALADRLVDDVCGTNGRDFTTPLLSQEEIKELKRLIREKKFVPGGRYLYYAGRASHAFNNCLLLKAEEDTREEWGALIHRASDCLMAGAGIGVNYSILRPRGTPLIRTGGAASGPVPLMCSVNEVGRNVKQGGGRRSAIWAGLNWQHGDIFEFTYAKNWSEAVRRLKEEDFNFPAQLDMTNISVCWDTAFIEGYKKTGKLPKIWYDSVKQMLKTAEPGHSYDFYKNEIYNCRNACAEVVSADDSDICNLGSVNIGAIDSLGELVYVVELAAKFLVCGTVRADLPYQKVYKVREKNRRIGLGLMGIHAWLIKRGYKYEVVPELHDWLLEYRYHSEYGAKELCDDLGISRPIAYRSIAPTGTISILASTTTGIEPLFATAYKRRYIVEGNTWKYEYVIDATAQQLINETGADPDKIETAYSLAGDPERRIRFQADVQDYVDMAISSTINLPAWGTPMNNDDTAKDFAELLAKYAHRLRGFTAYPDGARGGQPITEVSYSYARGKEGVVYEENEEACKSGVCGV